MSKRRYNLLCIKKADCFTIQFEDLDRMRRDFHSVAKKLFKMQI